MTLTHRRIIYLVFMAIFVVVLPLIILHVTGYRYNSKKNILQKTGIIFLESKPTEVDVWLNNKLIDSQTPSRIKRLLPNEYDIKLTKEGYYEWNKKIKVSEGQTTFLQYVRLFKSGQLPHILLPGQIEQVIYDTGRERLIAISRENQKYNLVAFDLASNSQQVIFERAEKIESIKLVDNGTKVVIYSKNNIWLLEIDNPKNIIDLRKEVGLSNLANLKIDEFNSNNIYYLQNGKLIRFNLSNKNKTSFPYLMFDYEVQDNYIYYLANDSLNNTFLKKANMIETENIEIILSLDRSNDYKIVDIANNTITVKIKDRLIVWNQILEEPEVIQGVDYYEWNKDHDELLFGNQGELWSYRLKEEQDKYVLFTRLSQIISEATWYPIKTHVFYVVDNKIKVTENLFNNRYTTQLAQLELIKNLLINKKGDKIYFIGQIGKQQGLYELEIQ